MCGLCEAYDDGKEYRQCIACEYICSDDRTRNENPPWPCPSCKRVGHWSDDVDWSAPERAMARIEKLEGLLREIDRKVVFENAVMDGTGNDLQERIEAALGIGRQKQ